MTGTVERTPRPLVSIVVLSYNYRRYLATALESALSQTYDNVEVIAVDDGSDDGSRELLTSYRPRVRVLLKSNGGNSSAVNAGFPLTRGEVVMFLDADDLLYPGAAAAVAAAWSEGCAKVQFRLTLIDAEGRPGGVDPPLGVAMPVGDVVPELIASGSYTTPVMTGNAFGRSVLERLLPIPVQDFRNTDDGYLNALCPFLGTVTSLNDEWGAYRLHGKNIWAFSGAVTPAGMRQRVDYDLVRERYLRGAAGRVGRSLPDGLLLHDPVHVLQRLACLRPDGVGVIDGDRRATLLAAGLRAVWCRRGLQPPERLLLAGGMLGAGLLPRRGAVRTAGWVLASRPRPAWLRACAGFLGRRRPSSGEL